MSYGPRPKNGNYSVLQLSRFLSISKTAAAEAIANRLGRPQRQISYACRKSLETTKVYCAIRKITTSAEAKVKVTSTSNLIIDGKDSGQKSMKFFDICQAFDALDFEKQNDWMKVADGYINDPTANPQIKYADCGVTYIFSY